MWNKRLQTAFLAAIAGLPRPVESDEQNGVQDPNLVLISQDRYEIRPFITDGDLYTFAEFQELLKKYSCSDDNGTGYWATPDGIWFDKKSGEPMGVYPEKVRLGRRPELFFTHVIYYGK
jgi:hypothetical protein